MKYEDICLMSNDFLINRYNRKLYKRKKDIKFPSVIGLSLSKVCTADCIFCPITRNQGKMKQQSYIDYRTFKKVINELSNIDYKGTINLGSNGDCFLHPKFKRLYYELSLNLDCKISIVTNMNLLDKEMAEFLLLNKVNSLVMNMDGNSIETYNSAKRRSDFKKVKINLHDFIKIRDKYNPDCKIKVQIMSAWRYLKIVKNMYTTIPYDANETINYWKQFLSDKDEISEAIFYRMWNEPPGKIKNSPCYHINTVLDRCWISTSGDLSFCCLDYRRLMKYGNVNDKTIYELWNSDKRKEMVNKIVNSEFDKTGKPCKTCNEQKNSIKEYIKFKMLQKYVKLKE